MNQFIPLVHWRKLVGLTFTSSGYSMAILCLITTRFIASKLTLNQRRHGNLFNQLLLKLHERGEIPFQTLFIDGTKLEANANKYTFGWKGSILNIKRNCETASVFNHYNQTYETNHPVVAKQLNPTFETCLAEYLTNQRSKHLLCSWKRSTKALPPTTS